ncbi:Hypothetical protein A7982_08945 [Minicystis rosea]|nr:Hypothetical protein A7982_08945 [Minicystis rosea]
MQLNLSIEGCLEGGVSATLLTFLHPLDYPRILFFNLPVVAVELWACAHAGAPAFAVAGLHLVFIGILGLFLARRSAA